MKELDLHIGKIVGTTDNLYWSQTHVFIPENEQKKNDSGSLLASFCLKAKQEGVDITSFGKEIISRFHEIYYSSVKDDPLLKLKSSLELLQQEFAPMVELELAALVVYNLPEKIVGYFAVAGQSQALIFRDNKLVKLLAGEKDQVATVSGFLKDSDLFVLGSHQLIEIVSLGALKASLENKSVNEAIESLASIIHSRSENSQTAAIILQIELKEKIISAVTDPALVLTPKPALANRVKNFKNVFKTKCLLFLKTFKTISFKQSLYLKDEPHRTKAKKTTFTVALILLGLLLASIIFGIQKKSTSQTTKLLQSLTQEVEDKYNQAVSLKEVNPQKSRILLIEAKDLLAEKITQVKQKEEKTTIENWQKKVLSELEKVANEYALEEGEIFLDLSLAKQDFKATSWAVVEDKIYIFDQEKGTILKVEVENKSAQVVAGGEKLVSGKTIAAADNQAFVLSKDKILVIDLTKKEIKEEIKAEDWGEIIDLVGFSSNLYLLDKQLGQIWKYRVTDSAKKSAYLKGKTDFSQAVSLAIDGSIWIMTDSGEVIKFTRGEKDPFTVSGLDKPFNQPIKLVTNENLDNLYILDRKNTGVVVINKKTGERQAQYIWSGIAGVSDLIVFEDRKEILLLTSQRIYKIDLR